MEDNKKYIIYKGTGGLFHNLGGMSAAIAIAKKENRVLINDMFSHIRINYKFNLKFEDFFVIDDNTFEHYNNYDTLPVKSTFHGNNIEHIINITPNKMLGNAYFYNEHDLTNINSSDDKLIIFAGYNRGVNLDIKVNSLICKKLNLELKIPEAYLSIHYRNTDMKHDIGPFIRLVKEVVNKTVIRTIYLASDDVSALETFKQHFPNIKFIRTTVPDNSKEGGLHYIAEDKNKQMYDCLKDIYYILHSNLFISSRKSAYSAGICNMIKNKKYIFPNIISNTRILM